MLLLRVVIHIIQRETGCHTVSEDMFLDILRHVIATCDMTRVLISNCFATYLNMSASKGTTLLTLQAAANLGAIHAATNRYGVHI